LAHLLIGCGAGPGQSVALVVKAFRRGGRGDAGSAQDRGGLFADRPGAADRPDRLMLDDAAPIAAIIHRRPAVAARRLQPVVIDLEDPQIHTFSGASLPAPAADDSRTSSNLRPTGVPKGVAITHTTSPN